MSEWQPIETAEKGVVVLGSAPDGRFKIGRPFGSRILGKWDALIDGMSGRWMYISHWMPLPEPPVASSP